MTADYHHGDYYTFGMQNPGKMAHACKPALFILNKGHKYMPPGERDCTKPQGWEMSWCNATDALHLHMEMLAL